MNNPEIYPPMPGFEMPELHYITVASGGGDDFTEGDWGDEEDEDFDDLAEDEDDLNEIRVGDDLDEPDPEDDDHLPDDDQQ